MFLFYSKKNLNITITGDFGRPVFTHEVLAVLPRTWTHLCLKPCNSMLSCDLCVLLQEFFHYAVGALLVFIASVVAAVKSGAVSALVTASVCEN